MQKIPTLSQEKIMAALIETHWENQIFGENSLIKPRIFPKNLGGILTERNLTPLF